MDKPVSEIPVIGLSVTEQIGQRAIVLQTHVASDVSDEEINKLIDRVMSLADRQKLYYETREDLFKLRANLDNHEINLDQMIKDMQDVEARVKQQWEESGRKGGYQFSKSEASARANALKNVESFKFNIERLKKAIADNEAILAKIGR